MKSIVSFVAALSVSAAVSPALSADIERADREAVVQTVIRHLETDYVDVDAGRRGAARLKKAHRAHAFEHAATGTAFAEALTTALRTATGDGHLAVEYSDRALSGEDANSTFTAQEMERYYGAHVNFGVEKIERLQHNIGLLELRVFPPARMGGDVISAAMQSLRTRMR